MNRKRNILSRIVSSRVFSHSMLGIAIAIVLTVLELGALWLFNLDHLRDDSLPQLVAALEVLPEKAPLLLLIPLLEVLAVFLIAQFTTRPVALRAYIRDVQSVQARYRSTHTSLTSFASAYETMVAYYQNITTPNTSAQRQELTLLDIAQQERTHLLILGPPGIGKTFMLQVLQALALRRSVNIVRGVARLPIYLSLEHYSLYLNRRFSTQFVAPGEEDTGEPPALTPDARLLDFLHASNLPGMRHLRPYLDSMLARGTLLFLCDDFNLVDARYRTAVAAELVGLMRQTQNDVIVTCCDLSNEALPQLEQLVDGGVMACAVMLPLLPVQVRSFVEHALGEQHTARQPQYTAGQIMQAIDHTRLRYLSNNPLMLFTLLEVIDGIDVEQIDQSDTRARLLRLCVAQAITRTQGERKWRKGAPEEDEVFAFLSRLAAAMYATGARNTLQLPANEELVTEGLATHKLAEGLRTWLDDTPVPGPLAPHANAVAPPFTWGETETLTRLLEFVHSASLLTTNPDGLLSFRHASFAEYLVAEYFLDYDAEQQGVLPLREEFLADAIRWSGPIAMWAGLLDDPLLLAERFVALGQEHSASIVQSLALSLVCIGVAWKPPQFAPSRPVMLPMSVAQALALVVHSATARAELVRLLMRFAEEGTQEIYQALLALLMVPGADELLLLLDSSMITELLFDYLCDAIDNPAYDAQVKRLIPVLGRFGPAAVPRAAALTQPAPDESLRLRAAAVRILARTGDPSAVASLVMCLGDSEMPIAEGALKALIRFGPALVLDAALQELGPHATDPESEQVQSAALTILDYFLNERDPARQLTKPQRQRVLDALVPLLSSQSPPETQQHVKDLLLRQIRGQFAAPQEDVVEFLVRQLAVSDETLIRNVVQVLQQGGSTTTSLLLTQLERQSSEVVRVSIVEVLAGLRDPQAVPSLLRLLGDPAPLVQKQAAIALQHAYMYESIPGLIDLVLWSESEVIAARAAQILADMGEEVVESVMEVLPRIVPGRTQMLIQVLETAHDLRTIPALIALLKAAQGMPLLIVAVIRALSLFSDSRVAPPLIDMLSSPDTLVYEEAINALSMQGGLALAALLDALVVAPAQETVVQQRARRALLGMNPFPGEQLLDALPHASDAQAEQVMSVFQEQGAEAALLLVEQLFYPDERVCDYIRQTLDAMPGQVIVPALLEVLNRPAWRQVLADYLLKYPDEAIPPLVSLLHDPERNDAAAAVLLRFGPSILPDLVSGLDDPDPVGRTQAEHVIAELVLRQPEIVAQVVHIFGPTLPQRAHDSLVEVLTSELADVSVPPLLAGLGDAYLLRGVSESLAKLVRKRNMPQSERALRGLLEALRSEDHRHGAEITLTELGGVSVSRVGELIIDPDPSVAHSAQHILRDIGVPAFSFIWAACSDVSNRPRREAALDIFRSMPTLVIKNELIAHLASDNLQDSAMAATLLRERIHDEESSLDLPHQEMVPALLEHVQTHEGEEHTNLRVIALLLLIEGEDVVNHIAQALYDRPDDQELLSRAFLFLGQEGEKILWSMYNDPETPPQLANRVVSVLGTIGPYPEITDLAVSLAKYGLSLNRGSIANPEQLDISLRALGGLLAGGHWNASILEDLRRTSKEGSMEHELYEALLGWRYGAQITRLENELESEQGRRQEQVRDLTIQLLESRTKTFDTEHEMEQLQQTLAQTQNEVARLRQEMARAGQELARARLEHGTRGDELTEAAQTNQRLQGTLARTAQEKKLLSEQLAQLQAYNAQLVQQLNLLQGAQNP